MNFAQANKTGINLINFSFTIRGKLYIIKAIPYINIYLLYVLVGQECSILNTI